MKKIINIVLALMLISSAFVYSQENPDYTPFNTQVFQVPLTQNFSLPSGSTIDNTKISFDVGTINLLGQGRRDVVTTFSVKYTNNSIQKSGNRGYWNINLGNNNYETPSGPFLNQNENKTAPENFSNDNAFVNLRNLSIDRKDLAVVKNNGLYVYRNDNSEISSSNFQYIPSGAGRYVVTGNLNKDNSLEDVAVVSNDQYLISIFMNDGSGNLSTSPAVTISLPPVNPLGNPPYGPSKVKIGRIFHKNKAYELNNANIKSDLVVCYDSYIFVYKNNSDNTFTLAQQIFVNFIISDFTFSDLTQTGWNDLIIVGSIGGISKMRIYKNIADQFYPDPIYTYNGNNSWFNSDALVTTADLSYNGRKDLIVASKYGNIALYQNTGVAPYFTQQPQNYLQINGYTDLKFDKINVDDINNQGGMALILSKSGGSLNDFNIFRFNPSITNTNPSPPIILKDYYFDGTYWRPRLHIDKNEVYDYNNFILYKKSPGTNNQWNSIPLLQDQFDYVDYNEICVVSSNAPTNPRDNCFYYAVCVDKTNLVSVNSNTVGYLVGINNPNPIGEILSDNRQNSNNEKNLYAPKTYSVSNFPNPFNPVTNIFFNIPKESKVTIKIYNTLGQEIQTLTDKNYGEGNHIVEFNASNLPSGVYFYRISAGEYTKVNRLMLLK